MSGEFNATNAVLVKNGSTIVGQMEFTLTHAGEPIDISNKSYDDFVTLLDGELSGKQLIAFIKETVEAESTIYSDEFKGYNQVSNNGYKHERVDHTQEFAVGDIHTNSIESFWAVLKRGIMGIYHHVSTKYLQLYVNEFAFRWNNRESDDLLGLVAKQSIFA